MISFMCKKLNKLEDVRIFNLLNNQKRTKRVEILEKVHFAFNKVVP